MSYRLPSDASVRELLQAEMDKGLDESWSEVTDYPSSIDPSVHGPLPVASPPKASPLKTSPRSSASKGSLSSGLGGAFMSALRKSWRGAEPVAEELDTAVQSPVPPAPAVTVEQLEQLLLWSDPWLTGRVFGAGLYVIVFLQQIVLGALPLQVSTVVAAVALSLLGYNVSKRVWARRGGAQAGEGEGEGEAAANDKAAMELQIQAALERAGSVAAPYVSAAAALVMKHLSAERAVSGHVASTVWLALLLWLAVVVGELQLLSQPLLMLLAWAGLFSLPWLYSQCRDGLERLCDECLRCAREMVATGDRASLLAAGGVAMVAMALLAGVPLYLRLPAAAAAGVGTLAWRASKRQHVD